ncbi:ryncolin-2 isoform X2 [Musca domestica]|uniref:Ryncolin-2 isoform X2 n=1 Tax=Musca domestica TaxID=7370 RepID=A0ABM3VJU0_MUSDO|nr:ryncolin-2 isoform X2 [Musca domestica]
MFARNRTMKIVLLIFAIAHFANAEYDNNNNSSTKAYLDLNNAEDNVILWKNLFIKLNDILDKTQKLDTKFEELSERLEVLNKRVNTLDNDLKTFCPNNQNWITIQRRQDASVSFNRSWEEYGLGFGDANGNYFMGLQRIYEMTNFAGPQELLIILKDFGGDTRYAKYDRFRIGSEEEKYALLEVGNYSGNAGNNFKIHEGHPFTTFDRDNDNNPDRNNAVVFAGGWWFFGLGYHGYLNGPYRQQHESNTWGISWHEFRLWNGSLKYAEMLIRRKC